MSGTGIVVIAAIIVVVLGAFYVMAWPGSARREDRRRSSHDTGVYPGGVYPVAADTGPRDGRGYDGSAGGHNRSPGDPTPDAGSSDNGSSGSSSGGDSGGSSGGDGGSS